MRTIKGRITSITIGCVCYPTNATARVLIPKYRIPRKLKKARNKRYLKRKLWQICFKGSAHLAPLY